MPLMCSSTWSAYTTSQLASATGNGGTHSSVHISTPRARSWPASVGCRSRRSSPGTSSPWRVRRSTEGAHHGPDFQQVARRRGMTGQQRDPARRSMRQRRRAPPNLVSRRSENHLVEVVPPSSALHAPRALHLYLIRPLASRLSPARCPAPELQSLARHACATAPPPSTVLTAASMCAAWLVPRGARRPQPPRSALSPTRSS